MSEERIGAASRESTVASLEETKHSVPNTIKIWPPGTIGVQR
jgi:hypothetical protein